ncbi:MAG: MBL fold metallo-hydrolase [Kiritimatiellaeota bacterium]|nr:MBL fold metallo-hydrolase [Kiritimatiellota bacterium]
MNRMMFLFFCGVLLCAAAAIADEESVVTVGKTAVTALPDAPPNNLPVAMFTGLPEEQMKTLAPEGTVRLWRSVFTFTHGGKRVMVDTGMGDKNSPLPNAYPKGAKGPDVILLTHLHSDHIGGLLDGEEARFPDCKVYMAKPALDHWKTATGDRAQLAQKIFKAYGERVLGFADGEEVLPGLFGRFAFGHTPGHALFETEDVLFVGDLLHGASVQFAHPEVCASFDMDKPAAVAQRKAWLKKAAQSGKPVAGCHLPYIGTVKEQGEGFTFTEVK